MVQSLNKKWKEILFSFSGFGPNFLMILLSAYFTDAVNPAALPAGSLQAISGTCLILPGAFSVLWMLSKAFDGIIDIPFAAITDSLSTKWGRRRPPIAICFVPMLLSYIMLWIPFGSQTFYTFWVFLWALVFFSTYTMCLICFYGSLSTVCTTEKQRTDVSAYKAFFDTISYCLVYALVPLLLNATGLHIDKFALVCVPLMFSMIIPLFMIKEGEKYGYPENMGHTPEKVSIFRSLKLTFGNKIFCRWLAVNCCSFFGLQMFLVSMNALILGGMGMNGAEMALLNTFAFAPVPIMLYLYNKIKAKKGLRFVIQVSMLAFAVAIFAFDIASVYVMGSDNKMLQYIIGCAGSVIASFSIGSFFMTPYLIPSQISAVEEKLTGINHSAMYFAAQAVTSSVVGAISGLVYENIKMLFISKEASGIVYAESTEAAALKFGADASSVFNLGTLLVPVIVSVFCLAAFFIAFKMPKNYTVECLKNEFKGMDVTIDESVSLEDETDTKNTDRDSVGINIALWVLSGSIFGFIWQWFALAKIKDVKLKVLHGILSMMIPFYSIIFLLLLNKKLSGKNAAVYVISGIVLPLLPLNFIALSLLTKASERLNNQ